MKFKLHYGNFIYKFWYFPKWQSQANASSTFGRVFRTGLKPRYLLNTEFFSESNFLFFLIHRAQYFSPIFGTDRIKILNLMRTEIIFTFSSPVHRSLHMKQYAAGKNLMQFLLKKSPRYSEGLYHTFFQEGYFTSGFSCKKTIHQISQLDNPRSMGKALSSNKTGFWRYRVGDYRIICDIEDAVLVILVVEVNHRSKVYKTR